MTGRERVLDLPELRVAAMEWGPDDAPPLLALHGWLDNLASFCRLAPLLDHLHVVAIDLPGHGRSARFPAQCSRHFVDWVPVVLEAANAIGWQKFSLMGHSMGAGIATLVSAVARERIDRVVLLEGAGPLSSPAEAAPEQLTRALRSEAEVAASEPSVHADLESAVTARLKNSDLDRTAARLLVERGVEPVARGVRFTYDPRLKTSSRIRLTEEQVLAFLGSIDCPVLIVRATQGWPFSEQIVARRLEVIADLQTARVEGGHHVHLTHPDRVAPLVREFVGV
jgi:pimeloyl-ACP methyl ester carboxylesterase